MAETLTPGPATAGPATARVVGTGGGGVCRWRASQMPVTQRAAKMTPSTYMAGTDTHMPPAPRKSPTRRVPKQSRAERYVRGSSISSLWNALPCDGDEGVLGGARDAGGAAVLGQQLDRQKERERKADGGADAERLRGPSGPIGIVRPSSHGIEKEHEAERRRTDRRKAGARIAPQDRKTDEGGKDRHRAQPAEGGYRRGRRKKEAKARGRSERAAGRSELEQEQLENGRGRQEGPGADAAPLPTAPPADARQRSEEHTSELQS